MHQLSSLVFLFAFLAQALISITSTNHPSVLLLLDICMLMSKKVNCVSSQVLTTAQAQVLCMQVLQFTQKLSFKQSKRLRRREGQKRNQQKTWHEKFLFSKAADLKEKQEAQFSYVPCAQTCPVKH